MMGIELIGIFMIIAIRRSKLMNLNKSDSDSSHDQEEHIQNLESRIKDLENKLEEPEDHD